MHFRILIDDGTYANSSLWNGLLIYLAMEMFLSIPRDKLILIIGLWGAVALVLEVPTPFDVYVPAFFLVEVLGVFIFF